MARTNAEWLNKSNQHFDITEVDDLTLLFKPLGGINSDSQGIYVEGSITDLRGDVLDIQIDNTLDPGATPNLGDRYIITDSLNLHANFGTITGIENNDIVEYDGANFVITYDASTDNNDNALTWVTSSQEWWHFDGLSWHIHTGLMQDTPVDDVTVELNANNPKEVKIKEINYIIDDDGESIDGSDTPMVDEHHELVTRAYVDGVQVKADDITIESHSGFRQTGTENSFAGLISNNWQNSMSSNDADYDSNPVDNGDFHVMVFDDAPWSGYTGTQVIWDAGIYEFYCTRDLVPSMVGVSDIISGSTIYFTSVFEKGLYRHSVTLAGTEQIEGIVCDDEDNNSEPAIIRFINRYVVDVEPEITILNIDKIIGADENSIDSFHVPTNNAKSELVTKNYVDVYTGEADDITLSTVSGLVPIVNESDHNTIIHNSWDDSAPTSGWTLHASATLSNGTFSIPAGSTWIALLTHSGFTYLNGGYFIVYSNEILDGSSGKSLVLNGPNNAVVCAYSPKLLISGEYEHKMFIPKGFEFDEIQVDLDGSTTTPTLIRIVDMDQYPQKRISTIKEIDYIIDDDGESIDGSDTPMSNPHRELVTRAYLTNTQTDSLKTNIIVKGAGLDKDNSFNAIYTLAKLEPITYISRTGLRNAFNVDYKVTYNGALIRYEILDAAAHILYYSDANASTDLADHTSWNVDQGVGSAPTSVTYINLSIADTVIPGYDEGADKLVTSEGIFQDLLFSTDSLKPFNDNGGGGMGTTLSVYDNKLRLGDFTLGTKWNIGDYVYFYRTPNCPDSKADHVGVYKISVAESDDDNYGIVVFEKVVRDFYPSYTSLNSNEWAYILLEQDFYRGVVGINGEYISTPAHPMQGFYANRELMTRAGIEQKISQAFSIIGEADDITIADELQNINNILSSENTVNDVINNNWQSGIDYEWSLAAGSLAAGRFDSVDNGKGREVIDFEDVTNAATNKVWDEGFYVCYISKDPTVGSEALTLMLQNANGGAFTGNYEGLESGYHKISFYISGIEDDRRITEFGTTAGDDTPWHMYLANMALYPLRSVHTIKEIDYIIDDDNESIDGSDTPMVDAHHELTTRAYIDSKIDSSSAVDDITINKKLGYSKTGTEDNIYDLIHNNWFPVVDTRWHSQQISDGTIQCVPNTAPAFNATYTGEVWDAGTYEFYSNVDLVTNNFAYLWDNTNSTEIYFSVVEENGLFRHSVTIPSVKITDLMFNPEISEPAAIWMINKFDNTIDSEITIKNINWIIGNDGLSIDEFNAPSVDPNHELVTKQYVDDKIADADEITIHKTSGGYDITTNNDLQTVFHDAWSDSFATSGWSLNSTHSYANGVFTLNYDSGNLGTNEVLTHAGTTISRGVFKFLSTVQFTVDDLHLMVESTGGIQNVEYDEIDMHDGNFMYSLYFPNGIEINRFLIQFNGMGTYVNTVPIKIVDMDTFPKPDKFKIEEINYIIDDDNESIDGSDTPMSDPHHELITRAYTDTLFASNAHWNKVSNVLTPADPNVEAIEWERNFNGYTRCTMKNTDDAGNGAGAVIELKGSGANYTNNVYIGKYGNSFWLPFLAGNGAVMTDKNLVVGTVTDGQEYRIVTGGGYTDPTQIAYFDENGLNIISNKAASHPNIFVEEMKAASGHSASHLSVFVDTASGQLYSETVPTYTPLTQTTEKFTVTAADVANGYIDVTNTPNTTEHLFVYINGLYMDLDVSGDYTLSTNRINFITPITVDDKIIVKYSY